MDRLYIPQIARAPQSTVDLAFRENLPDLETLTPVEGKMSVRHGGTFLEVRAQAKAVVTLTCDRTLVQFNHRLEVDTTETLWLVDRLPEKYADEVELTLEELVENLPRDGYFDPGQWLYEQFCLAIPYQKIAPDAPPFQGDRPDTPELDRRWAALAALQETLPSEGD
ncbi:MAG: DUF177 domain-containing protein [Oscillatoriales cyanobacterium SM2_1_8]|nr:DUF177 domain-containing protein [Oscillatoriales cyanobacterium SM2_1_8]